MGWNEERGRKGVFDTKTGCRGEGEEEATLAFAVASVSNCRNREAF
jgi:hypothetical protein